MSHRYSHTPTWSASQSGQSWASGSTYVNTPRGSDASYYREGPPRQQMSESEYSFGIPSHLSWPSSTFFAGSSSSSVGSSTLVELPPVAEDYMSVYDPRGSGKAASSKYHGTSNKRVAPHSPAHPSLTGGSLWYDCKYPISTTPGTKNYCANSADLAFAPPLARVRVRFADVLHWEMDLASTYVLTVGEFLNGVYHFLQQPESHQVGNTNTNLKSRSRGSDTSLNSFVGGRRRIDFLGRRRIFFDVSPCDDGTWVLRLCDPSAN